MTCVTLFSLRLVSATWLILFVTIVGGLKFVMNNHFVMNNVNTIMVTATVLELNNFT